MKTHQGKYPTSLRGPLCPWQSVFPLPHFVFIHCTGEADCHVGRWPPRNDVESLTHYVFAEGPNKTNNLPPDERCSPLRVPTHVVRACRGGQKVNCPKGKRSHPGVLAVRNRMHYESAEVPCENAPVYIPTRHCEGLYARGNPYSPYRVAFL